MTIEGGVKRGTLILLFGLWGSLVTSLVSEHHVGRGGTGKYREEGLKMGRQLGGPILFGHFCFQNTENMTETLFFFSLFIF